MNNKIAKVLTMSLIMFLVSITAGRALNAADPYVIGFQTDVTGMGAGNMAPTAEGFRAYMESINGKGGINGHPVKVVYEDDKSSPQRAGAIATKFALEDKVLAIGGLSLSLAHRPVYEVAKKHGVPVVAGYSCQVPAYDPVESGWPEIFAAGPIMIPEYNWPGYAVAIAVSRIVPKGGSISHNAMALPGGRVQTVWATRWCEKLGYKVVFKDDVPPGIADVSPWVQKTIKADSDIAIPSLGTEATLAFWTNLEKMGWTKPILTSNFPCTDDFLKTVDALMEPKENIYMFSELAMPLEENPPLEYKEMEKALNKYGHDYTLSGSHARGWIVARVIEAALGKAGWPCDRPALLKALEKTDLDTKGLTGGHIRFSPTDHYGPAWVKVLRWDPHKRKLVTFADWHGFEPKEIVKEYSEFTQTK